jgi:hypothetical protein
MTIQESLSVRLRRAKIFGLYFWAAFAVTAFLPFDKEYFFLSLIPFICFGLTVIYILFFVRRPKCNTSLGLTCFGSSTPFKKKPKVANCPHCKINFNASM